MYNVRDHARMRLVRARISMAVKNACANAANLPADVSGEQVFHGWVQYAVTTAVGNFDIPTINVVPSLANGHPNVQLWADPNDPLYQLWEDACPFALA